MRRAASIGTVLAAALLLAACAAPAAPVRSPSTRPSVHSAIPTAAPIAACTDRVAGDTDGDGFADPLVGAPGSASLAGSVTEFRGGGSAPKRVATLRPGHDGLPGTSAAGDGFGDEIAVGDFNGDGCADAAVLAPFVRSASADAATSGTTEEGTLTALYGTAGSGLGTAGSQLLDATTVPLPRPSLTDGGGRVTRDLEQVVAGDFEGDGFEDLAILVATTDEAADATNAAVIEVRGGPSGLEPATARQVAVPALPSGLGAMPVQSVALAAGDSRGGRTDDLAVTAVTADGDVETDVVLGAPSGLGTGDAALSVSAPAPDGSGAATTRAESVFGDFDGDGFADLAVALPDRGTVTIYPGGGAGSELLSPRVLRAGVDGVPDAADGEQFGATLAAADVGAAARDALVVGSDAGRVWVLLGARPEGATVLPGTFENDGAPLSIAAGPLGGAAGDDLIVGAPDAGSRSGAAFVLRGTRTGGWGPPVRLVPAKDVAGATFGAVAP